MTLILPSLPLLLIFVPCVLIGAATWLANRRKPKYRMVERYIVGSNISYRRPIKQPKVGTISLPAGVTIDPKTGEVWGGNECGSWRGEFDVEVKP